MLFCIIEVVVLENTFEIIKKTEQDGDNIISSAKEQISKTKEEVSEEIKKIENMYNHQINALKDKLQQEEKNGIIHQQALMDKEFVDVIDSMKKSYLAKKEDLLQLLVGKVMRSNGNSSY